MVAVKLWLAVACLPVALPTQEDVIETAVLKSLGLKADQSALREFVIAKTPRTISEDRFERLVHDLASEDFKEREAAQAGLVRGGPAVVERLRSAARNAKDPEQVKRLGDAAAQITNREWPPRAVATYRTVVRAVARRADPASAACLLDALPTLAGDDEVSAAVWRALDAIAVRTGKVPAPCAAARADERAECRAAAAFLLGRRGTEEQRRAAAGMLADADPSVRLRAAQGLLGSGDLSGVSALVGLLDAKPVTLAWEAEELLVWLAGKAAPPARVGDGGEAGKAKAAWGRWRETAKPDWEEAASAPGRPMLLLLRGDDHFDTPRSTIILGSDGQTRWTPTAPDGQVLIIDCVTAGRALGCIRAKEPKFLSVPSFVDYPIGGELRVGPSLDYASSPGTEVVVRRWGLWTLVAGMKGYGFIATGQSAISHKGSIPLYKDKPTDKGVERSSKLLGERDGLLWYAYGIPSSHSFPESPREPTTGEHPFWAELIPSRTKIPDWRAARVGTGRVRVENNEIEERVSGRLVWQMKVSGMFDPRLSAVCPLLRLGFDDLSERRRTLRLP